MMRWLLVTLVLAGSLLADGGMFVPDQYEIEEYGQVGIVKFFNQDEELAIATNFYSLSSDIAWVLPLPSEPAVDSVSVGLFRDLEYHCRPLYRGNNGFSCGSVAGTRDYDGPGLGSGDSDELREVSGGIIGDFVYQVLWAAASDTLEQYLRNHGYSLPSGVSDVFQHYLAQNWNYFVVARARDSSTYYQSRTLGIRLAFSTDSIVFPLYISRIGTSASPEVILYVAADHRQMFPGARLRFSGPADSHTFSAYPDFIDHACRLTKLTKSFRTEEMQDLTLRQAPDDQDYREVQDIGGYEYASLWTLSGLGLVLMMRRRKKKLVG
jgi:hypothetical protein